MKNEKRLQRAGSSGLTMPRSRTWARARLVYFKEKCLPACLWGAVELPACTALQTHCRRASQLCNSELSHTSGTVERKGGGLPICTADGITLSVCHCWPRKPFHVFCEAMRSLEVGGVGEFFLHRSMIPTRANGATEAIIRARVCWTDDETQHKVTPIASADGKNVHPVGLDSSRPQDEFPAFLRGRRKAARQRAGLRSADGDDDGRDLGWRLGASVPCTPPPPPLAYCWPLRSTFHSEVRGWWTAFARILNEMFFFNLATG